MFFKKSGRKLFESLKCILIIPRIVYTISKMILSQVVQLVKNLPAMQETWVQSLGLRRSPGEGNGNPLQYSCLENPIDIGVWQGTVHGVARVGPT